MTHIRNGYGKIREVIERIKSDKLSKAIEHMEKQAEAIQELSEPVKIVRDTSTAESKKFWEAAQAAAVEVQGWPDWRRAGINVRQQLDEPRPDDSTIEDLSEPVKEEPKPDTRFTRLDLED